MSTMNSSSGNSTSSNSTSINLDESSSRHLSNTLVIDNFSTFQSEYISQNIIHNNLYQFCVALHINASFKIISSSDDVFAMLYYFRNDSVTARYAVSILDSKGEKRYVQEFEWKFNKMAKTGHHIAKYITRSQILDPDNGLLDNDKLTVLFEIEILSENQRKHRALSRQPSKRMSDDFGELLNSKKACDVVLLVDGKELQAHKAIICARSPVFAAMFEHEFVEKRESLIDIVDVAFDVFEELLRYIYTGQVLAMDKFAPDLLKAADKYQLEELKSLCEQHLISNLSTESVADVLQLADLHQAKDLKVKSTEYIVEHLSKVKTTEGWKVLVTMPELLVELLTTSTEKNLKTI